MFQDEVGSHIVEMAFKVAMGADMAAYFNYLLLY